MYVLKDEVGELQGVLLAAEFLFNYCPFVYIFMI